MGDCQHCTGSGRTGHLNPPCRMCGGTGWTSDAARRRALDDRVTGMVADGWDADEARRYLGGGD